MGTPQDAMQEATDRLFEEAFLEMDRRVRSFLPVGWVSPKLSRRQRLVRRWRWRLNEYRERMHTAYAVLRGRHDCY